MLHLKRTELSKNVALNKAVVRYDYFEVVIDDNGDVVVYLSTEPRPITLAPQYLRKPPVIHSKALSNTLFTTMDAQKKWHIIKVK